MFLQKFFFFQYYNTIIFDDKFFCLIFNLYHSLGLEMIILARDRTLSKREISRN